MKFRKVTRKNESGVFNEVKFSDLKKGDHFTLEDDGDIEPKYEDGTNVYVALSDASPEPNEDGEFVGNYGIRADEVAGKRKE